MSSIEPSLKVPVAVNGWVAPAAIEALNGVSVIDVRVMFVTVKVALPTCPENTAEIVLVPGCTPVAWPALLTALLMVAAAGFEEVQFTKVVRSWVSPLLKFPVAPNGVQKPTATVRVCGAT
jgi:hypothetical protein